MRIVRLISCSVVALLYSATHSYSQDNIAVYTIKNSEMYIAIGKKIPLTELNNFIKKYDLSQVGLKRFLATGNDDSIQLAGWMINFNNSSFFSLTKPMFSTNDINDPEGRIILTGKDPSPNGRFPRISNLVTLGVNNFRNKKPFALNKSTVSFFLRNTSNAKKVMLAGSFNNWDPAVTSMKKTDSGWIAELVLMPGKYWYKFIIDGNWVTDADNRITENDGEGNTNSVYYVTNTVFRLQGNKQAKKVIVSGSFNNWNERNLQMNKTANGWELPVYLADGTHTYRYIVDNNWITDPGNPTTLPNEFNEQNSMLAIGKAQLFKLDGYKNAGKVILSGSFNRWREDELFMRKTTTGWELPYVLGAGNHEYKFIIDGKAMPDPAGEYTTGKQTSFIIVDPNYTFRFRGEAKSVFLSGDFNNWSPAPLPMIKKNGEWIFRAHLSEGKHLYKFIVDGKWIRDPANKLWEQNEHGDGNSVLWIGREVQ